MGLSITVRVEDIRPSPRGIIIPVPVDLPERSGQFIAVLFAPGAHRIHDLAPDVFFTALSAVDEEQPRETLELTATIIDGQLNFLEPAPLHAHGNEIRLGDKRVVIKLVPEEAHASA